MSIETERIESGDAAWVRLSRDEITILIGGVYEALFELEDDEFAIRVGPTANEARQLMERLVAIRKLMKNQES